MRRCDIFFTVGIKDIQGLKFKTYKDSEDFDLFEMFLFLFQKVELDQANYNLDVTL